MKLRVENLERKLDEVVRLLSTQGAISTMERATSGRHRGSVEWGYQKR